MSGQSLTQDDATSEPVEGDAVSKLVENRPIDGIDSTSTEDVRMIPAS